MFVSVECDAGKNRCLFKDPNPASDVCTATDGAGEIPEEDRKTNFT